MEKLRHLQLVVLEIAKDMDALCKEHGIEYYLGGGGAIGAIRHKGYIPWDDDLDFLMTYDNYEKFISVCRVHLDKEKYYLALDTTGTKCLKIKLKGTKVIEKGKRNVDNDTCNIFLDVFRLDKAPTEVWKQRIQYYFSKLYVAYTLSKGDYIAPTRTKQLIMGIAKILHIGCIRRFVLHQIEKYNARNDTDVYGCFWGITRFHNTFTRKEIYGKPLYVSFEDTFLPVPERYDEYLTQFFGNYMQLPPVEKRVAPHIESVDFGNY